MSAEERRKLLFMKGDDHKKIKNYILRRWPDLYAYHENPLNPAGWDDCFLKRKIQHVILNFFKHFSGPKFGLRRTISKTYLSRNTLRMA